ncbi:hypothetical protein DdX_03338 [Ditylenchus destructor]|uniref:Uncharacterized protein n=1 Tax=Ditylenchus destructor TaxID=166010 RepID=A0AAD4R6T9_9BILA|nr:hypothetical protein DdX_03338 [Ditylenchus destructor]
MYLFLLCKCTLAQHYPQPITPADSYNHVGSTSKPEVELVDQIESIEVTANQVVIQTSRVGPAETVKVAIQVVDIENGAELPPTNLTGILLILTRGRYTVNFLTPNRWYGILFRCEQQYGGPNGVVYVNEEEHLIKTHKEDGSNLDAQPLVSVTTKRFGSGGRSLENLVVTVRWEQHPDERSVEVRLDNHFEIMEFYNNSRQIMASISPKNCPRICWNAELVAETTRGLKFRRAATHNCLEIEAVSASTTLRDYVSYEVHHDKVIVHTNYSDHEHDEKEVDSYIQLAAIPIPEPKRHDNNTVRFKTYSTSKTEDGDFVLDHLEPNKLYAIQYTYGKQSPFAYAESRRFVVETRPTSSAYAASHSPVRLVFDQPTPPPFRNSTEHGGDNSTHPAEEEQVPRVSMRLTSEFKDYEVGIDVEPFCDPHSYNGSHFWLTKDKPTRELRGLKIIEAICDEQPKHMLCNGTHPEGSSRPRKCSGPTELCYTANVMVHDSVYSMERKCENLAKHFHPPPPVVLPTHAVASNANSWQQSYLCYGLLLPLFLFP